MGYNFNFNRKKISDAEVEKKKNFNSILDKIKDEPTQQAQKRNWLKNAIKSLAIVGGAVVLFFINKSNDKMVLPENTKEELTHHPIIDSVAFDWTFDDSESFYYHNQSMEYKTRYGTKLVLPENLLEMGNSDSISIQVTEFHDWAAITMAKIPMVYDSANVEYAFETAGMIDIRTPQGDYIFNEGKHIQVEMVSLSADKDFNHYVFNEQKNEWQYAGKEKLDILHAKPDGNTSQKKDLVTKIDDCEKRIVTLEARKPEMPKKYDKKRYNFQIEVDQKEFPELSNFQNLNFEVEEGQGFTASVFQVSWDDMSLERMDKDFYKINLYKNNEVKSYRVFPALSDADFSKVYHGYLKRLDEINQQIENENFKKKEYQEELNQLMDDFSKNKEENRRIQLPEKQEAIKTNFKKGLDFSRYVVDQSKVGVTLTQIAAVRSFNITGFGLFNSDKPVKYPSKVKTQVSFQSEEGETIRLDTYFLSERDRNSVYTFGGIRSSLFMYNPKRDNIVWGQTQEGIIAISKVDNWHAIEQTKVISVVLHKNCKTPKDLRTLLSIL